MLTLVTPMTKRLDVVQAVRHVEVGKAVDRFNMVRVRGLGGNRNRAPTAIKVIADQSLPLEVSAAWPLTVGEEESRLPFVVFRVRLLTAGLIRGGRPRVVGRFRIMEVGQHTVFVNPNGVLKNVLADAFGSRYVFLPAYRFHRSPESLLV